MPIQATFPTHKHHRPLPAMPLPGYPLNSGWVGDCSCGWQSAIVPNQATVHERQREHIQGVIDAEWKAPLHSESEFVGGA